MLGYVDCRLMVLGTKLYMAKSKIGSNMSYGTHLAAIKADKIKEDLKGIKEKVKSIKKVKVEVEMENANTEDKPVEATVEETVETETPQETVNTESCKTEQQFPTEETNNVENGPDFTPLQGVYYDPEAGNFSNINDENPAENSEQAPRVVTVEDVEKALAKEKAKNKKK